jgi:hypothetical protein
MVRVGVVWLAVMGVFAFVAPASGRGGATPAQKCAAAKVQAADHKTSRQLACYERAYTTGKTVSAACLSAASAKFNVAFAKAEAKGGCATPGDRATVEAAVDSYVATLAAGLLSPSGTTTTTTTFTTTTVTTTSTTTTTMIPCGGFFPVCLGSCPIGMVCTAPVALFCSCN